MMFFLFITSLSTGSGFSKPRERTDCMFRLSFCNILEATRICRPYRSSSTGVEHFRREARWATGVPHQVFLTRTHGLANIMKACWNIGNNSCCSLHSQPRQVPYHRLGCAQARSHRRCGQSRLYKGTARTLTIASGHEYRRCSSFGN